MQGAGLTVTKMMIVLENRAKGKSKTHNFQQIIDDNSPIPHNREYVSLLTVHEYKSRLIQYLTNKLVSKCIQESNKTTSNYSYNQTRSPPYTNSVKLLAQSNSITPLHELRQTTHTIKLDHPLTRTPSNYSHNQLDHPLHKLRQTTRLIKFDHPLTRTLSHYSSNQTRSPPHINSNSVQLLVQSNSITPLHELRQTTRTIKLNHPLTRIPSNYSHNQTRSPLTRIPSHYSSNQT